MERDLSFDRRPHGIQEIPMALQRANKHQPNSNHTTATKAHVPPQASNHHL